jgi:hypothetical protein
MLHRITILCVAALFAVPSPGQMWLRSPRVYDQAGVEFRAAADADGDGDVDLIRVEAAGFRVMFNDGAGQLAAGPLTPAGGGPFQVQFRDLTGDGIRDVAYASGSTVQVHQGSGGGAFGSPMTIPIPGVVTKVLSGDADGDGPDDLAVVHFDASQLVRLAWIVSVSGGFVVNTGAAFPLWTWVDGFALIDLGNDGVDDLATLALMSGVTPTVTLHPTANATPGTGASFVVPSYLVGGLVAGDADADGDVDLVVASSDGSTYSVIRILDTGGGTFAASIAQTLAASGLGPVYGGDVNGDSAVDVLVRGEPFSGTPYVLFANDGAGSFSVAYEWHTYAPGQLDGPGFLSMNGDAFLDFVGPSEIAFGDGTFVNPLGTPGPGVELELDWDDDGDLDWFDATPCVRRNDGRGTFTNVPITFPAPPPTKTFGQAAAMGDFDGDGFADYVTGLFQLNPPFYPTFLEAHLMHGNGDGSTSDAGLAAPPGVSIGGGFSTDLDDDGDVDIVGTAGVSLNDGSGFFTAPTVPWVGWAPYEMRDVDGDGDQDFLALAWPPPAYGVAVLRRTTPGTFAIQVLLAPGAGAGLTGAPVLTDLDGDGDRDVALDSIASGNAVHAWLNAAGVFSAPIQIVVPGPHGNNGVAGADVDGDGLVDLVLCGGNRVHVHRRTGAGFVFEPPRTWVGFQSGVRIADIDNDGDPDVLTGSMIRNTTFHGPPAGFSRQYGVGTPGSGGFRPILGLKGPVRVGSFEHLIVSRALGGAPALVVVGATEAFIPDFGLPGLTAWVQDFVFDLPLTLGGPAGQAGKGAIDVAVGPLPPSVAGVTVFLQLAVADPGAPYGLTVTNGVEVHHGL